MVVDRAETEHVENLIVCLRLRSKLFGMIFIYLPKYFVVFVLLVLGGLWLISADSIGDLILNSLALAFVVTVDEMIAKAYFPSFFFQSLKALAFVCPDQPTDPVQASQERQNNFLKQAFFLALSAIVMEIVIRYQPVVPNYQSDVTTACMAYIKNRVPFCVYGQTDCFPKS